MKTLLLWSILIFISGCSSTRRYGDFTGTRSFYGDNDTMVLLSPFIDKKKLTPGPQEFLLRGVPSEICPLNCNFSGSFRAAVGLVKVEFLTYPEREWIGTIILSAEVGQNFRTVTRGGASFRESMIVRVTELKPLSERAGFRLGFTARKNSLPIKSRNKKIMPGS